MMDDLSDAAWRVLTSCLMWSNASATDGRIPARYFARMHPSGDAQIIAAATQELEAAGIVESTHNGMQLLGWDAVDRLNQSTAEQMAAARANAAERARRYREQQRTQVRRTPRPSAATPRDETGDVTRDKSGDVTQRVGRGRGRGEGQDPAVDGGDSETNTTSGLPVAASMQMPDSWDDVPRELVVEGTRRSWAPIEEVS
ncbi:hypothetical protein [Rathayibacter sp. AY1E2]|uniref:hypothetical protein n=1 Tax=Rathayibacter sp. AY1E2 TaxID=2080550 RepID=UPI0011B0A12E|nr:hypothetical protein [Rathayibacter sp. AY1E2]